MLAGSVESAISILRAANEASNQAVLSRDLVVAYSTLSALCHYFPSRADEEKLSLLSSFAWIRDQERSRFLKQRRIALRKLLEALPPLAGG